MEGLVEKNVPILKRKQCLVAGTSASFLEKTKLELLPENLENCVKKLIKR